MIRAEQLIRSISNLEPPEHHALLAALVMADDMREEFTRRAGSMGSRGLIKPTTRIPSET